MVKRKPQGRWEGSWQGRLLSSKPSVLISNWLFQGMRYMNRYEIGLKILLELGLVAMILAVMGFSFTHAVMALPIAHSLNWILNGHFFVLMRFLRPVAVTVDAFDAYCQHLKMRGSALHSLQAIGVYGSYCRGKVHAHSDLDVRVFAAQGFWAAACGAWFCFSERLRAVTKRFPLDIYLVVHERELARLSKTEIPVVLFDKHGRLTAFHQSQQSKKNG